VRAIIVSTDAFWIDRFWMDNRPLWQPYYLSLTPNPTAAWWWRATGIPISSNPHAQKSELNRLHRFGVFCPPHTSSWLPCVVARNSRQLDFFLEPRHNSYRTKYGYRNPLFWFWSFFDHDDRFWWKVIIINNWLRQLYLVRKTLGMSWLLYLDDTRQRVPKYE